MSCSSCSTGKDGTPAGCGNNGSCGTTGCNKLNIYNWLAEMDLPSGQEPFNIVEVRFKGTRKEFFKNPEKLPLLEGDIVAVESNPGHDIGVVSMAGELVRFQLKKKKIESSDEEIKTIYRKAKQADVEKWRAAQELEESTMHRARSIALSLKLSMKISDVEYQGDMKKASFYYTADERVDFRELIKRLAEEFKVRIEMRQIGMRQEAGRLGGIGSCGRELCCSTWLSDFRSVSTSAARYQNLSLNPLKLAGQCGKLKCCLNYELDSYMDAIKDFPDTNITLYTEKGNAVHKKTDIFKRAMWYGYQVKYNRNSDQDDSETIDHVDSSDWVMLSVDRVKEIIKLNKQNTKPAELAEYKAESKEIILDFENVVGQDSITRLDHKKSKKKKKKKKTNPDQDVARTQETTVNQTVQPASSQQPNNQRNNPGNQSGNRSSDRRPKEDNRQRNSSQQPQKRQDDRQRPQSNPNTAAPNNPVQNPAPANQTRRENDQNNRNRVQPAPQTAENKSAEAPKNAPVQVKAPVANPQENPSQPRQTGTRPPRTSPNKGSQPSNE